MFSITSRFSVDFSPCHCLSTVVKGPALPDLCLFYSVITQNGGQTCQSCKTKLLLEGDARTTMKICSTSRLRNSTPLDVTMILQQVVRTNSV